MHELYELKEKLMEELKQYGTKEMTAGSLDVIDKLTHTIKNLCKIIEESEYSETGANYQGGNYSRPMSSYARGGRGGYSRANVKRDSMGRYSSAGDLVEELRDMMQDAPNESIRMDIQRLVSKMERV
jgi:hypothetical protein